MDKLQKILEDVSTWDLSVEDAKRQLLDLIATNNLVCGKKKHKPYDLSENGGFNRKSK